MLAAPTKDADADVNNGKLFCGLISTNGPLWGQAEPPIIGLFVPFIFLI
jgi:hypothetical protein